MVRSVAVEQYSSWNAGYQGVRGSGQWDLGWGWNNPSKELVDHGFETGDPRKGQTILFSGAKDDSLINDGKYGNTLPPSIWPYFNKKTIRIHPEEHPTGDRFGSWLDLLLLRYSDVLLMAAEAAMNWAEIVPRRWVTLSKYAPGLVKDGRVASGYNY